MCHTEPGAELPMVISPGLALAWSMKPRTVLYGASLRTVSAAGSELMRISGSKSFQVNGTNPWGGSELSSKVIIPMV